MSLKSCSVKVVCLTALLCLSIAPVALFYICATMIRTYITTSGYVATTCLETETTIISQNVTCHCLNETGHCVDQSSCVRLKVKFELPHRKGEAANALMYENYEAKEKLLIDNKNLCSYNTCIELPEAGTFYDVINENYDVVNVRGRDVTTSANLKQNFTCFVNPEDESHVLHRIPKKQDIFNGIFWPLFGIFLGLCFCVVAKICTREKD